MKRMLTILFAAVFLAGGFAQPALAALGAVGPVNPANGFPVWYQDTAGLRLDLCLDQTGFCLTEEPNPAAPISFPNNFGPEAFWWNAEAAFDDTGVGGTGISGLLVLAMEATAEDEVSGVAAVEGQQVAFARIRIRVDVPVSGNYTVTHPFGQMTFNVPAAVPPDVFDGTRAINVTQDIGNFLDPGRLGNFALALADDPGQAGTVNADGRSIGPFLTRADGLFVTDPISGFTYIGSPAQDVAVTGSPLGTNFFRVVGPTGTAETNLFSLMGKVSVNQPAAFDHAEYHLKTGKFHAEGFSTVVAVDDGTGVLVPTEITIHLGTVAPENVIGTALVNPTTGIWTFNGKAPLSPGGVGRTLAITSTADPGGAPTILPLVLR